MQAMESTKPCGENSLNLAMAMLGLKDLGVDLTSPITPVNVINNIPTSNRSNVSNFSFNLPLTLTPLSPTHAHVTSVIGDGRTKKYQSITTTECVPVPSCDHVAEIVGRQGTKIKALRIKTNTHIKTPARGEEPVFIVTGRKDDVFRAKREILYAALHFTQIRAARKTNHIDGTCVTSPSTPGHITIPVHVPYDVVGLVVGPKGATVKKIQQQSNTYIVTPSRDKEPIFYVTGTSSNVQLARQEIEAHIAVRTGRTLEIKNSSDEIENVSDFTTIDKNTLDSILNCNNSHSLDHEDGIYKKKSLSSGCSSVSSQLSLGCLMTKNNEKEDIGSVWGITKNVAANFERDEGIGESPSCETATLPPLNAWSFPSFCNITDNSPWSQKNTICVVCEKSTITTALVPCGHNMFCQECGDKLSSKPDSCCPVCGITSYQAIRIISP